MTLAFHRLKSVPECLKIFTLMISVILMLFLGSLKDRSPGMSLIWFTITVAIIYDVVTITFLIKEFDISFSSIRRLPYASIECVSSIIIMILYVLSTTLLLSHSEITGNGSLIVAAVTCLLVAVGYLVNIILNIKKWMDGEHLLDSNDLGDFTIYGSD